MTDERYRNREDDFDEVMRRARARARGETILRGGVSTVPKQDRTPEDFAALVQRVCASGLERLARGDEVEPQRSGAPKAWEVRVGWYVPSRFTNCRLELCPRPIAGRCECQGVQHFVCHTRSQREAHRAAVEWAANCGRGHGLALALLGPPGTGKSHLLYAAVYEANRRGADKGGPGVNVGAWGWFDLADHLRAATSDRDPGRQEEGIDHRNRVKAVKAFALDEIRPTSGTDYDGTQLSNLMTRAYRECQDVLVTSNHGKRPSGAKAGPATYLEDIVGIAAGSRLTMIQVEGPDYRQSGPLVGRLAG